MTTQQGFTLIELLVVVLIIGILVAMTIPQYQKTVEKGKMVEAVTNVRAIANANQVFFMANGRYASFDELECLDVFIPGSNVQQSGSNYLKTKDFLYAPTGRVSTNYIALAKRLAKDNSSAYSIYISNTEPDKIQCYYSDTNTVISNIQRNLCQQINQKGTL